MASFSTLDLSQLKHSRRSFEVEVDEPSESEEEERLSPRTHEHQDRPETEEPEPPAAEEEEEEEENEMEEMEEEADEDAKEEGASGSDESFKADSDEEQESESEQDSADSDFVASKKKARKPTASATAAKKGSKGRKDAEFLLDPDLYGIRRSGRARKPASEASSNPDSETEHKASRRGRPRGGRGAASSTKKPAPVAKPVARRPAKKDTWNSSSASDSSPSDMSSSDASEEEEEEEEEDVSSDGSDYGGRKKGRKQGRGRKPAKAASSPRPSKKKSKNASSDSEEENEDLLASKEERDAYDAANAARALLPTIDKVVTHLTVADFIAEVERLIEACKDDVSAARADAAEQQPKQPVDGAGPSDEELPSLIDISTVDSKMIDDLRENHSQDSLLFCIKWQGFSNWHNSWHSEDDIREMDINGKRKVDIYIKTLAQKKLSMETMSQEDIEFQCIMEQMGLELAAKHCIVERIINQKTEGAEGSWETYRTYYLCKWEDLPYADATWEDAELISKRYERKIEEYLERNAAKTLPKRNQTGERKFKPMKEQPFFLGQGSENHKLRDYQLAGLNWLAKSWCMERSGILADEMGLGKTVQCVSFLSYLFNTQNVYGPFLVIVPLSTFTAWQREFAKWCPNMNVVCYGGNAESRRIIQEQELYVPGKKNELKFNVLLTTPEPVKADAAYLGQLPWTALIVDEAHCLKNHTAVLYTMLQDFRTYRKMHKVLVTGTPLQNSMKELWALLHFIMPNEFQEWEEFADQFGEELQHADPQKLAAVHDVLKPYLLRRVKKDVEKSLPAKVEQILRVDMTERQRDIYKMILERNYGALRTLKGKKSSLVNIIMELKKCCNHTRLISEESEGSDSLAASDRLRALLRGSGKLMLLDKLLARFKERGNRVLIFSQMVIMLDVIAEYLRLRGYIFQRLDGNISANVRKQAIDHFNAPDSTDFCFILSTRAGGLGVNLATADTVIIFDSDWNPQNDLQAQARAHRIGQKKLVNIFRLVTKSSVEEDILERAKRKMVLDHLVIQTMDTTGEGTLEDGRNGESKRKKASKTSDFDKKELDKSELDAILKFGAKDLFKDSAKGRDNELEQMDLDEILGRAETRDTTHQESGIGHELLSQFKTVDIALDETDADEVTAMQGAGGEGNSTEGDSSKDKPSGKNVAGNGAGAGADGSRDGDASSMTWDDIIPEDVRRRLDEEERSRIFTAALAPRQRTKANYTGLDGDGEDEEKKSNKKGASTVAKSAKGSGGSNGASAGSGGGGGSNGSSSKPTTTAADPIPELEANGLGQFRVGDFRKFVKSAKKFGDVVERAADVHRDADLGKFSVDEVKQLGRWFLKACADAIATFDPDKEAADVPAVPDAEEAAAEDGAVGAEGKKQPPKKKPTPKPTLRVGGERVLAQEMLQRVEEMRMLTSIMKNSVRVSVKDTPKWDVKWTPTEDNALLKAAHRHGFGNWELVKKDASLPLQDVILLEDPKKKPQKQHLDTRVALLLRELQKSHKVRPPPSVAVPVPPKKESKDGKEVKTKQSNMLQFVSKPASKLTKGSSDKDDAKEKRPKEEKSPKEEKRPKEEKSFKEERRPKEGKASGGLSEVEVLMQPVRKDVNEAGQPKTDVDRKKSLLYRIGNHIEALLDKDPRDGEELTNFRDALWDFVGKSFEGFDGTKVRKMYKAIVKTRESAGGDKMDTSADPKSDRGEKRKADEPSSVDAGASSQDKKPKMGN